MIVRGTTRIYETKVQMHHAEGALKRYGWKIQSKKPVTQGKNTVYEIRAVKGWGWVVAIMEKIRETKEKLLAEKSLTAKTTAA